MDFFDENFEDYEISEWLPFWSHVAACAKIKMELEAKGYELEELSEFMTDDEYLKILRREALWGPPFHPHGIFYVQKKDMLGISVELFGQRKEDASEIIRQALREFNIPFQNYSEDFPRDMFIIPLHRVWELIDEYHLRKNSSNLYPLIPSHKNLEPEIILEIEKLKRSDELIEMSFKVRQFAKELDERFGNRLHDFVNRHLGSK